jgi:hypothetical protein
VARAALQPHLLLLVAALLSHAVQHVLRWPLVWLLLPWLLT